MIRKVSGFILGGLLLLTVASAPLDGVRAATDDDLAGLLRTFSEALATVEQSYARPVDSTELVENAVKGMLRTLDPHSSFFSAPAYGRLQEEQQGQYFGLGISIRPERPGSGRVRVVQPPAAGTPAFKVGMRHGDVIAKVEGEPIDDWTVDQVISTLKGPKGVPVNITVERPGESEPLELTVVRDAIPVYSIRHAFRIADDVGYIHIDRFAESTGQELRKALAKIDEKSLKGLILDLRNNPGGALSQAIAVTDCFLDKGQLVVTTRGRGGSGAREYKAPRGDRGDYPMVVLINRHSASASEIVSGALQDHDRALILGETSFGKALVQTVFPLRDGRGLALTTGKYYTPSNRLIQRPYSEGFYDYLSQNNRGGRSDEVFSTDSGRKVFGGGGIRPDIEAESGRFTRLVSRAAQLGFIDRFGGMLTRGEIKDQTRFKQSYEELKAWSEEERNALKSRLRIAPDDKVVDEFAEFLRSKSVVVTADDLKKSRAQLANQLQREVFLRLFGEAEAMKVHLEIDDQVQLALKALPQAAKLKGRPVSR